MVGSGVSVAGKRRRPLAAVARFLVAMVMTVMAAIGVMLPWRMRLLYARVLRWLRNLLMHNLKFVRRWALRTRWEWDGHDS